ncbi:P-loop containing nucleoside triphosphate hydrolase protein [Mycena alexandri]|uniref:P-loop containing nucleoside triphosphate hydrolase protein n=1 Tax=Mycena alexandri TaxID=1745969 RepID=A0AAD6T8L4_9AGAR|nr:P-loop containing nucleoside triphosphate hydrolase protein [Mycena alexandri]
MALSYYLNKIRGSSTDAKPTQAHGHVASSVGLGSDLSTILGFLHNSYVGSSVKLLILGSIVETGRRLFRWIIDRFGIQYCTTIRFSQGDPAYEWIVLFLTQENVWRRSREFTVSASNSRRKWAVRAASDATVKANAEYVPTYQQPQLFRWRGYWVEIKRTGNVNNIDSVTPYGFPGHYVGHGSSIYITIYTLDMNVLSELVEEARLRYLEVNRPNVVIYLTDSPQFGPSQVWATVKHKMRRPLSSIILPEGVVDSLVADAQEFLGTENWYIEAGIPHRRGYLLYGPPGTGKTSTIYALAGALNLEIYSLSLASNFVDDSYLQRAASAIPKHGLFLIEDIDCAFPPREEDEDEEELMALQMTGGRRRPPRHGARTTRSMVTLSGLLNVIDGVGSEEGKLFFATTNHIDRLDGALLRPGRIDRRVQYELATPPQAHALFNRFFPTARFPDPIPIPAVEPAFVPVQPVIFAAAPTAPVLDAEKLSLQALNGLPLLSIAPPLEDASLEATRPPIAALAEAFATAVPSGEFSTAELQGYLQGHKTRPAAAARGVHTWVAGVRSERAESERRKEERRVKAQQRKAALAAAAAGPGLHGVMGGLPVGPLSAVVVPVPAPAPAADDASAVSVNGLKGAENGTHVNGEKSTSNGVVYNTE